jgi:AcrR family transcriptional regulator
VQVLKDEIRKQILDTAKELFLEHGFLDTTTRMIAKQVGISVSSLYLYYENKEELFYTITEPYYQSFTQGFASLLDHKVEADDMGENIGHLVYKMIVLYRCEFLLVLEKSKGTNYEGFKITLIEKLKKHIQSQMQSKIQNKELLALVFAKGIMEGIIIFAKEHKNSKELKYNLECLIDYHVDGIKRFLK